MLGSEQAERQPRMLIVGAFPPADSKIFGGVVSSCRVLLASSLPKRAQLTLVDTTQASNPVPPLWMRLWLAVPRFFKYVSAFERSRPDVILLFTAVGASVAEKGAMAWYARLRGVPAMMCPRGGAVIDDSNKSRFTRFYVRAALRGARTVLCQGPAWQRFVVDTIGFKLEQAPIVPNWTATPQLLSIGQNRIPQTQSRPLRLLFVGWLDREKGVFELIEACRQLSATHHFELNLVGEGNASEAIRELVARHKLEDVVTFSGWLSVTEVETALAEADVFVLPSWVEGLPNAMIEAMAARLPVIVSAVGNIPDVVVDGRDALLIPPQDIPSLRAALARVLEDEPLRRQLADHGFVLAERQFGAEQAADRILDVVHKMINEFGNQTSGRLQET
ncbi:MAG TPA: glycosyltransferase family 4 protein [Pyrinomonadaceae bacterium]|jgi:glycosyltransferase involved in cell wall biosynthesis|nr:glycosyltransferase family 4 protein [Pyrinomonadaceae bacterium]